MHRVWIMGLLILLCISAGYAQGEKRMNVTEPNIEIAKTWWPEMEKKWTVVGWPEHIARFNVFFDGTILNYYIRGSQVRPGISEPWAQFIFAPAIDPDQRTLDIGILGAPHYTLPGASPNERDDYGDVIQGWDDCETPVLWSEWAWHGYLLREQVFAHVPGGKALTRGDEPLFAWVRLSVHYASPGLPLEKQIGFGVRINGFNRNASMEVKHNLNGIAPKYDHELHAEDAYQAGQAFRILEPDSRVRLAVAPGADSRSSFRTGAPSEADSMLHIQLPPEVGGHVDLLVPMTPMDRAEFDRELALGYDGALREAEAFWSKAAGTASRFEVPEAGITEAIRRNLQTDRVTAEKDPATGETLVVTAGYWYGDYTWATPVSLGMAGFLDPMGCHSLVEKYLKPFKENQGKVIPPGESFKQHPGYLAVPQRNVFLNWLTDHGAILWVMAQHGLLTGDQKFIEEYTPVIVKACEWIRDARKIQADGAVAGLMPPAGASDDESRVQNCWTDGWIYKGLTTAVDFLKATGNPRAAEFEAEAKDYRETFQKAFRAKAATMATWTDDRGKERRFVPFSMSQEKEWQFRHLFYLDTGPMQLVFAGLMDADDPLMKDAVDWYREGPPSKLYRPYGDLGHVPSLRHEMSSWEACYSWNVFHNWQLGDRQRFLEGLYSQFTGAMSQQTYTVCESRGGMTSCIFCLPAMMLARLAVIDDQVEEGALHLLRLCPLAWLSSEKESEFENMPTRYGPVDLHARLSPSGDQLQVTFTPHFRGKAPEVLLHIPPVSGLKSIMLNGKPLKWDGKAGSVEIP